MRSRNLLQDAADGLLRLLGASVVAISKILFSGLDKRSARQNKQRLKRDVEASFSYLLETRHGRVLSNDGARLQTAFDYASLTVQFNEISFQIVRGRGELRVRVAAPGNQEDWRDMNAFLLGVNSQARAVPTSTFDTVDTLYAFDRIAESIQTHWEPIVATIRS